MSAILTTALLAVMLAATGTKSACSKPDPTGMDFTTEADFILPIPFRIHLEPMDRLLLINFEDDPDSLYMGFEPRCSTIPSTAEGSW